MDAVTVDAAFWGLFTVYAGVSVAAVVLMVRRYANLRTTPWYATTFTVMGWMCALSVLFLVPTDMALATLAHEGAASDTSRAILANVWLIVYWITFGLTWAVCPFLKDYVECGGFTFCERFKAALKLNVIFYLVALGIGLVIIIPIFVTQQWSFESLFGILTAIGNFFGLTLLMLLLGYGLVEVPRRLWQMGNRSLRVNQLQFLAVQMIERVYEAQDEMVVLGDTVRGVDAKVPSNGPLRERMNEILRKCELLQQSEAVAGVEVNQPSNAAKRGKPGGADDGEGKRGCCGCGGDGRPTIGSLVSLHARVMEAQFERKRVEYFYEQLAEEYTWLTDVMANPAAAGVRFVQKSSTRFGRAVRTVRWFVASRCAPALYRIAGILCALLSLLLIWCEVLVIFNDPDLSVFSILVKIPLPFWAVELVMLVPAAYMLVCSTYAMFQIKIFTYYQLFEHQHTLPGSLLFSAAYMSRMAAPLAYSVMHISRLFDFTAADAVQTGFQQAIGNMDVVPVLGNYYPYYAGCSLVVLCLLTLFSVGRRLVNSCKCCQPLRRMSFVDSYRGQKLERGRALLEQAQRRIARTRGRDVELGDSSRLTAQDEHAHDGDSDEHERDGHTDAGAHTTPAKPSALPAARSSTAPPSAARGTVGHKVSSAPDAVPVPPVSPVRSGGTVAASSSSTSGAATTRSGAPSSSAATISAFGTSGRALPLSVIAGRPVTGAVPGPASAAPASSSSAGAAAASAMRPSKSASDFSSLFNAPSARAPVPGGTASGASTISASSARAMGAALKR